MSIEYSWWADLRHGGCLITPARLVAFFPETLDPLPRHLADRLRREVTALEAASADRLATLLDTVLETILDLTPTQWKKANDIPVEYSIKSVTGDVIRPRRLWREPNGGILPVFVDVDGAGRHERTGHRLGVGRGRRAIARVNEWLRKKSDVRIALLTNGSQWRLIHAGQDYDAWCEWDTERWFSEGEPSLQVTALRALLGRQAITAPAAGALPALVTAILESRKGQSELSAALGERVRQAVELLIGESRPAIEALEADAEHAAYRRDIYIAATRLIMRCVVVLFAEARDLLPRNNPIYHSSYGIQGLREQLERDTGGRGPAGLRHRVSAWPRLLALFRLICDGSEHEALPIMRYGGGLFHPGKLDASDPVLRALSALESPKNELSDATVAAILDCLTRAPIRVRQGHAASIVHAPVDFSQLDTEYIGILYQGLLDYELRKAERVPLLFLNLGDQPVLPLDRLEAMDDDTITNLVEKMAKTVKPAAGDDDDDDPDNAPDDDTENVAEPVEEPPITETVVEVLHDASDVAIQQRIRAQSWARRAVIAGNLVSKPRGKLTSEKQRALEDAITYAATQLISRTIAPGEYFLVRWGGTRKGTGTFYTKPALAGPTVRRTLEPLCYDSSSSGRESAQTSSGNEDQSFLTSAPTKTVKKPAVILALKVGDISVGSGSFAVASLRYLTEALYESLFVHRWLKTTDDGQITLDTPPDPVPPWLLECTRDLPLNTDDPEAAIKARLRRIIVERCIYGVDLDPLAVELCRLSLWIETMDYQLPFSFLDHKIKVGNALVGCWFDRFQDYPAMAWEREGGDKNHTNFIHHFRETPSNSGKKKGDKWTDALKTFKNDVVKPELKQLIEALDPTYHGQLITDFPLPEVPGEIHKEAMDAVRTLHEQRLSDPEAQQKAYAEHFQNNPHIQTLRQAFDTWCAVWFWPADRLDIAPSPSRFFNPPAETRRAVENLRDQHRFFHWEIEFPDVFDQPGAGFDALIGNPPWENLQPNPKEYFSNIDPLFRTYGRLELLEWMRRLFADSTEEEAKWIRYNAGFKNFANWVANISDPFGLGLTEGETSSKWLSSDLRALWREHIGTRRGYSDLEHPFRLQMGRIFTYRLFLEASLRLLVQGGRLGMIVPSAIYTDSWTTPLRRQFLDRCSWEWLFSFENRDGIFDIHRSFKFCPIIVEKGGQTKFIRASFMRRDVDDWQQAERYVLAYPRERVEQFSPKSRAILEIRAGRDLDILREMYAAGVLLGSDGQDGWAVDFALEFMMNTDAKLFPPKAKWEDQGFHPDEYGHWLKGHWQSSAGSGSVLRWDTILSRNGTQSIRLEDIEDVALPLYEGRMIGQLDFSEKGWVSGKGRTAVWREIGWIEKQVEPQFIIGLRDQDQKYLKRHLEAVKRDRGKEAAEDEMLRLHDREAWLEWRSSVCRKTGFMDVTSATNTRTMIAAFLDDSPCGNKVPVLWSREPLALTAVFDTFAFDYQLRNRLGGLTANYFIIEETVLPRCNDVSIELLSKNSIRLSAPNILFSPIWQAYLVKTPTFSWRRMWAVTPNERLRLRCVLDAVVTQLYGISKEDFAWILRDCDHPLDRTRDKAFTRSLDAKGFWRVDKGQPPELRHTVLAQVAFHDLQARGLEAFMAQNNGEGWMLPETLRLSDYGLGHDERARQPQPVASQFGDRFLPWQLNEDVAQSWEECRHHAENIRAIRSRFAPEPATTAPPPTEPPQQPSTPPAVDLLGQPIPTDLFGNELPPQGNKRRR